MFNKAAYKESLRHAKDLDDFTTFSEKELAMTRIYNYVAIVVNIGFFVYFEIFIRYLFLIFLVFYTYRAYKLHKYLKSAFK